MNEFHNLAERVLNAESSYKTLWGNLGYWEHANTYPEACAALADKLAQAVKLTPSDNLIDVGFGCGDQLLHWLRNYSVNSLHGINLSESQTAYAKQLLIETDSAETAQNLHIGSANQLPAALKEEMANVSVILALDCAYHFDDRAAFLRECAQLSPAKCRLGLTDIMLARQPTLFEKQLLKLMFKLSHIPARNMLTLAEYKTHCINADWSNVSTTDITAQVFTPFADWLMAYRKRQIKQGKKANWKKYVGTAAFLRWAEKRRLLGYFVVGLSKHYKKCIFIEKNRSH